VFQEEGLLDIFANGNLTRIPALVAAPSQLPFGTQASLGVPAILDLGVILDEQKLTQGAPLICHLGEKTLRAWWELHKGESVDTRPFDIKSIDVNPELPPSIIDRIFTSIKKYISVFEGHQNTLPKPFDCPQNPAGRAPTAKSSRNGPRVVCAMAPWGPRNRPGLHARTSH
jgi:hypothetical protein